MPSAMPMYSSTSLSRYSSAAPEAVAVTKLTSVSRTVTL